MSPIWLQLLGLAVQLAPTLEQEIQNDINQHWGKDHVQQVVQGVNDLQKIVTAVGTAAQQAGVSAAPKAP